MVSNVWKKTVGGIPMTGQSSAALLFSHAVKALGESPVGFEGFCLRFELANQLFSHVVHSRLPKLYSITMFLDKLALTHACLPLPSSLKWPKSI